MRCNTCNKGFHQKCSTGPKASTRNDQWKCDKYTKFKQNYLAASTNCQLSGSTNSTLSQPQPVTFQNKLKIYQWNAGCIHPGIVELRDLLINSDVDVLALQESKLQKTDKTPFIEGYTTVQKGRNNILGGGLLLFIRTNSKLHSFENTGKEILPIGLKTTKPTFLELYNVYLPNTSTQHNSFDPSLIKPDPFSLILGDLNGHSQIRYPLQSPDSRGDEILDVILDNNLHILNDGSATRTSRITGNDSTPDISPCGSNWSAKHPGN